MKITIEIEPEEAIKLLNNLEKIAQFGHKSKEITSASIRDILLKAAGKIKYRGEIYNGTCLHDSGRNNRISYNIFYLLGNHAAVF